MPEEKVLRGIKEKSNKVLNITEFLICRKIEVISHPSVNLRDTLIDNEIKKELENLKNKG